MHEALRPHLAAITELCRRYRVAKLHVFGSVIGDQFDHRRSDIDFLVEFIPGVTGGLDHPYFGLQRDLQALLGRKVDLVMVGAVTNSYFAQSVNATKVSVYAAA
ncbi:MAG: nucleotidyltransferase family protein [Phycisphaerales bacterium]